MSINNTNRAPSKHATNISINLNLSFEIETSHVYSSDKNKAVFEDVKDGIDTCAVEW